MLQWVKVARYSFSGSIPPNFEHKFNRQKQRFGKIVTTILLDEDENLLWSGLQWHRSCCSNEMTKLPLLLAAVFISTGSCNYPLTIFCAIRVNITWQWRHNSFSSKPNSCPYRHFLWKCFTLRILWVLVFCCAKFHENLSEEFRVIFESLQKECKKLHELKTGLNADKLAKLFPNSSPNFTFVWSISVFHLCWHIYNLLSDSPWIITLVSWAVYLWTISLFYWLFENWFVCGSFDLSWTT